MQQDRAREYHRVKNWLFLFNLVISLLILILLLTTGLSEGFRDFALIINNNFYAVVLIYFILLSLVFFIISLPLDIYEGFILEHKFNLATDTFFYWLRKHLKKTLLSLIIGIILVWILYFFLRNFSRNWWILAGIVWFLFSIIFARIIPVVIVPLFYKYNEAESEDKNYTKMRNNMAVAMKRLLKKYGVDASATDVTKLIITEIWDGDDNSMKLKFAAWRGHEVQTAAKVYASDRKVITTKEEIKQVTQAVAD